MDKRIYCVTHYFFFLFLFSSEVLFYLVGARYKGRVDTKAGEMKGVGMHGVKDRKRN